LKAYAIILHPNPQAVLRPFQMHVYIVRTRVTCRVGEGFLHYSIDTRPMALRYFIQVSFHMDGHAKPADT
jgi:hypothetical protein